jgi:hypothetical protein
VATITASSRFSLRPLSSWERMESWRLSRRNIVRQFIDQRQTALNGLSTAWTDNISGTANLAAQAASKRVQAETKAKIDKMVGAAAADTSPPAKAAKSKVLLDSGSQVDLNAGTITLSNGAIVDIKTGLKKVNVKV